ncbi:hypothetical protein ACFVYA_31185 [Amycolatopsis sp. NPDC058278]|uniref:hypothetical protein n=1 Tax=Amycolatopsis sp. NPDC058278 TaxID=3346417 RepID=UPI0036DC26CC
MGPLPDFKSKRGDTLVTRITHRQVGTLAIDLDALMAAEPATLLLHERMYLLRKLQHAASQPAHIADVAAAVEHLFAGLAETGGQPRGGSTTTSNTTMVIYHSPSN